MSQRTLVIDTASPACSVALFDGERLIAADYAVIGRGHAERLIPMIAALPEQGRAQHIAVNCGPGSFTGIRIGYAAAAALALAWNAPLSGYSGHALVAQMALADTAIARPLLVAMHGGHGEFFVQSFASTGTPISALCSLPADAISRPTDTPYIAGSAAAPLAKSLSLTVIAPEYPDARCWTSALCLPDAQVPAPIYLRAPDAQPARA